jgi:hypothetical protein
MLERTFECKIDEITEDWRQLRNEEFNNFYASPNTIRMIESRKERWAGNVECIGEMINANSVTDIT